MSNHLNYKLGLDLLAKINQANESARINYILANDSWHLFHQFQTVVLSLNMLEQFKVTTISSLVDPKVQSSFSLWTESLTKEIVKKDFKDNNYLALNKDDFTNFVAEHWGDYWPHFILAIPFRDSSNKIFQIIILARDKQFEEEEIKLFNNLVNVSTNRYFALKQVWKKSFIFSKKFKIGLLSLFLIGLIPTKMSVNAPGEIISLKSNVVSSPIDGVIKEFNIKPNELVKKGDILFNLDADILKSKVEVATTEYESAYTDFISAQQKALVSEDSKAEVSLLESKVLEKKSELAQAKKSLDYAYIKADEDGYFIYTDENDWIGKPVAAGEKIGQLAAKEHLGVKIYLPADNAVELNKGNEVSVSLNIAPLSTIKGEIDTISFTSSLSPDNIVSYKLRAKIEENDVAKIGYRANVRIFGDRYPIIYQILRRPIGVIRSWLGL